MILLHTHLFNIFGANDMNHEVLVQSFKLLRDSTKLSYLAKSETSQAARNDGWNIWSRIVENTYQNLKENLQWID